jgi:outer membrane receptor for ferric coprogen and ferric-rhodotorulic acid
MPNGKSRARDRAAFRSMLVGSSCLLGATGAYAGDPAPPTTVDEAVQQAVQEVVVTATRLNTTEVSAITKMAEPIIDTSQSVKVFSADELALAGVTTLSDLGNLDSGQYTTSLSGAYVIQNYFRGFGGVNTCNDFPIKIDGFRTNCEMPQDLSPYGSVELLKGSSSSLYGQSFVAGTLVLVSKQPDKDFGGFATFEGGQFDHKAFDVDVHGSLTPGQQLYGRLDVAGLDEGTSFDNLSQKNITISPSLRLDFDPNDSITWLLSDTNFKNGAGFGFPLALNAAGAGGAANGANYSIPALSNNQLGFLEPPWAQQTGNWLNSSLKYEHLFEDTWHLTAAAEHYVANYQQKFPWIGAYSPISTNKASTTDVYLYWETEKDSQWAGEVNLFGDVQAFGHAQTLFFGADRTESVLGVEPYAGRFFSGGTSGFDVYQPNWSLIPDPTSIAAFNPGGVYAGGFASAYRRIEINEGAEFGALLRPSDDWVINLGARWSRDTEDQARVCCGEPLPPLDEATPVMVRPNQIAWTYESGLNYAITKGVHAYASWGTTFEAANAYGYNAVEGNGGAGNFLGPQKGATGELGLKGQSESKLINWTFDIFDTAITNSFQTDPLHPRYDISTGEQRATGFEAELQGKLTRSWDVTLSTSSTKNVYTSGELEGIWSPFAVKFGLSVFSDYQFQEGALRGLGVGGGYIHKTRAPYVLTNGADLSDLIKNQDTLDLRLFYIAGAWRFDISATNVTDERFVTPRLANSPQYDWYVNQPTQVLGKVTFKF